jgi:hypothetical protein
MSEKLTLTHNNLTSISHTLPRPIHRSKKYPKPEKKVQYYTRNVEAGPGQYTVAFEKGVQEGLRRRRPNSQKNVVGRPSNFNEEAGQNEPLSKRAHRKFQNMKSKTYQSASQFANSASRALSQAQSILRNRALEASHFAYNRSIGALGRTAGSALRKARNTAYKKAYELTTTGNQMRLDPIEENGNNVFFTGLPNVNINGAQEEEPAAAAGRINDPEEEVQIQLLERQIEEIRRTQNLANKQSSRYKHNQRSYQRKQKSQSSKLTRSGKSGKRG